MNFHIISHVSESTFIFRDIMIQEFFISFFDEIPPSSKQNSYRQASWAILSCKCDSPINRMKRD